MQLPRATHLVVINATHLRRLLRDYLLYYHSARTHLSLDKDAPEPRVVERLDQGRIVETPRSAGSITGTAAGPHRPRPTGATGLTDPTGKGVPLRPRRLFPLAGPMFGPTVFGRVLLGISVLARRGAVRPTAYRPRSLEEHPGWLNGRDSRQALAVRMEEWGVQKREGRRAFFRCGGEGAYLGGCRGVRAGLRCGWFGTIWSNSHRVSDETLGLGALAWREGAGVSVCRTAAPAGRWAQEAERMTTELALIRA
jgi:hypothetical protein